ncbi:YciI family protein [Bauldia litoralis]|uniref:Uncharacterized conserved protein n=1 Tax=Bauldia litoralis TaxID=665467 RepID=A0A1G6CE02_9HYPH|nr:YciI family protein [Bauldia litoralis]SDB31087.1 Uncharacterized conserved protein [Bauldia litoralis]
MKYLCLLYFDGKQLDAMSAEDKKTIDRDSLAYDRELERRGHFIAAQALQGPDSAVTVRIEGGKVSTTDGPYAETKEALGGFILIEADDLNQAIQLAGGIPLARRGAVEVRPIYDVPQP